MISVLILTYNESVNIAECIKSLPWRDDVHVLDSLSDDDTRSIATSLNAQVTEKPFTNYADQRNFGLALPFRNEWIVMLDADERMTPELAREIEARVNRPTSPDEAMMLVRRKDMFLGRWLRRSSGYPTWFARVMRKGRVKVDREINEEYSADGDVVQLENHILHYPFNKGVAWWYARHNRYSSMESDALSAERQGRPLILADLMARDPLKRRAALKQLAYRAPMRPFLAFFYLYVVRLGFLDGMAGYQYAMMRLSYEIMIDAKSKESAVKHAKSGAD